MPDADARSPRRRPVDVLFGEQVELKPKPNSSEDDPRASQSPGYVVAPPRPVTSVRPPPPELPSDWRVIPTVEPASVVESPRETTAQAEPIAPPPKPVASEPPVVVETIVEATTFTLPPADDGQPKPEASSPIVPATIPVTPPAPPTVVAVPQPAYVPAPLYGQTELVELSQFVDQLYQNVADETSDSAVLNAECLANLKNARTAIEKGEYAQAEAAAEQVKARVLRARASRAASASPTTRVLFAWLIVAALASVILLLLPFALRLVPGVIPLVRAVGLGMLGAAIMSLWQMSRLIARREYDADLKFRYAASPLFGAVIGAVMYVLSLLGIVAAPEALGITAEPFLLMYLFAFLGGLFSDAILGVGRGIAAGVTRR